MNARKVPGCCCGGGQTALQRSNKLRGNMRVPLTDHVHKVTATRPFREHRSSVTPKPSNTKGNVTAFLAGRSLCSRGTPNNCHKHIHNPRSCASAKCMPWAAAPRAAHGLLELRRHEEAKEELTANLQLTRSALTTKNDVEHNAIQMTPHLIRVGQRCPEHLDPFFMCRQH